MFSQKDIDAYRDIHAPQELKDSICNMNIVDSNSHKSMNEKAVRSKSRKFVRTIAQIAAVFLLLTTGFLVYEASFDIPEVYVDGQKITEQQKSIDVNSNVSNCDYDELARNLSNTISFNVEVDKNSKLILPNLRKSQAVDDSMITIENVSDTEYLCTINNADESQKYNLILQKKSGKYEIILQYDNKSGSWMAKISKQ